jgi:hypothetical protein
MRNPTFFPNLVTCTTGANAGARKARGGRARGGLCRPSAGNERVQAGGGGVGRAQSPKKKGKQESERRNPTLFPNPVTCRDNNGLDSGQVERKTDLQ